MRPGKYLLVSFMLIAAIPLAHESHGSDEPIPIIAEGVAPIIEGNLVLAKKDARRDAYRRAIEQGVGVELIAQTQMEMLQIISDLVITKATGYVQSHKILEEWSDEDGVYHVRIEARVRKGDIHDDLAGLKILIDYVIGNPVVMIIIQEENLGEIPLISVAKAKMSETFSSAGYHLVDKEQLQLIHEDELLQKMMAGDKEAVLTMGDRFGADILLIGQVATEEFTEPYTKASGLATVQALSSLKVIVARTGQIISARQSKAKSVHFSSMEAGNQAITKCMGDMADQLIFEIPTRLSQSRTIKIIVKNCEYSQRRLLMAAFQNIASVSNVFPRTFENNTATFDVKTQDSSESLAEALDALSGPRLNIITVNAGQVIAEVVPGN